MKVRRWILLFSAPLGILTVLVFLFASRPAPVLVFNGYEYEPLSGSRFAKFELRNTTKTPIWLISSGQRYPLNPPFVEEPLVKPVEHAETNLYQVTVGSFFISGEKLLPGASRSLKLPLAAGTPEERVGVCYYTGNFKDGNELIEKTSLPVYPVASWTLKARLRSDWDRIKRKFSAPKVRAAWCPQTVSSLPPMPKAATN